MTDLLILLIANLIPLYILVALGYISGKFLDVNLKSIALIAIYILAPIVNFGALAKMEFNPEYIALPIILFIASACIGLASYRISQSIWKNNRANLVGMSSVTGNTMYFGLPVVLALLGPEWAGVYALLNLGTFLNETGLGYFLGARGHTTIKGAVIKVLKFPVIHAIWIGFLYNLLGFGLPETFTRYWEYAIGAWVFLGMMTIGIALAQQTKLEIDWKLITNLLVPKFIVWPIFGFLFVLTDLHFFNIFHKEIYQMVIIISSVPLAGNLVAYATTLNLHPERAAAAVLISTIMAIATVPCTLLLLELISP